MCASPHTCFVFCRKGPEPEEMDKDIILQEKEAEVQSLKPNKLNLLNNCLSVKLSVWLCLCVCLSLSWGGCRRWSLRCRRRCRSREMNETAHTCEKHGKSTLQTQTLKQASKPCPKIWAALQHLMLYLILLAFRHFYFVKIKFFVNVFLCKSMYVA